jgi:hypothetical protein
MQEPITPSGEQVELSFDDQRVVVVGVGGGLRRYSLTQLVQASGLAVLVATHNMDIAARMDRRVTIKDGLVVELD